MGGSIARYAVLPPFKKKKKKTYHDFTAYKALLLSYYVAYIVAF